MREPQRLGPDAVFGLQVNEQPIACGRLLSYTGAPRGALAADTFHRLHGVKLPDGGGHAFAAGYWYAETGCDSFGRVARLPFPYNTYRRVKWPMRRCGGVRYAAAADLKLPLLASAAASGGRWHGLLVEPWLHVGAYRIPVFCSVHEAGAARMLVAGLFSETRVRVDRAPWFGLRRETLQVFGPQGADAQFTFRVCELHADDWPQLVQAACAAPLGAPLPDVPDDAAKGLPPAMDRAWRFLSRAEDHEHGALVHLLRRGGPGTVSAEFKHSHVTTELHALSVAAAHAAKDSPAATAKRNALRAWCLSPVRSVEDRAGRRWHTTTRLTAGGLRAFTHHGAGFVGFPGGQATNVRHLTEAYQHTGDDELLDAALESARWVLRHQRADGAWPATVRVAEEITLKAVGRDAACVAATAESVRAMLAAYQLDAAGAWLDAAERGLEFVNRESAFFSSRGYLRDAAPGEPDGLTAECATHANLDRAQFGPPEPYVAHAVRWGWYGAQWTRPFAEGDAWMVDGLGHTITPRIDVWGAMLLGAAWARLGDVTGDAWWRRLAWRQLDGCRQLQELDGGFAETWWYDWPAGLTPVPIESTFLVPAFLELAARFAPEWSPPAWPDEAPAQVLPGGRVDGPDGLVFEFREVPYTPPLMGVHQWLLTEAQAGAPGNAAARAIALLRLITGGEFATREGRPLPLRRIVVRYEHQARQARVWRWRYALSCAAPEMPLTVPRLYVRGARTVRVDDDALVAHTADGAWRIRITSPGNVAPRADGAFDFGSAVNWNERVHEFPVRAVCRRTAVST